MWVIAEEDDAYHVIPVGDLKAHDISCECWCSPVPDEDRPDIYVHNSLDLRELHEGQTVH